MALVLAALLLLFPVEVVTLGVLLDTVAGVEETVEGETSPELLASMPLLPVEIVKVVVFATAPISDIHETNRNTHVTDTALQLWPAISRTWQPCN